ncbi:MAG: XrtA/PEP-CTERM system histidine kinase PrsK, partial [Gammaproteobacteria bacterium]
MENIGLLLYGAGTLAFLALGLSVLVQRGRVNAPGAALFATFGLALWQGLLASHTVSPLPGRALLGAELLRSLALVVYLACTLKAATGHWARATATTVVAGMAVVLPALVAFALPALDTTEPGFTQIRAWTGVFISVGLLIALEQVFRNALPSLTLVRAACIALGITVIYDLYLFSDTLIFERLDPDQWRARAGVNLVAALFLSVAVLRNRATRAVSFSRTVVFYTASLTAAGIFLLTISVMGYLIRSAGGSWGSVLQLMLFFSSLLLLAAIAVSQRVRDEVRVFIAKNFFTLRYDYRQEWLNLIAEMSGKGAQEDLYVRAIRLLADLYKCPGGVLWLKQDREFLPAAPCRMKLPEDCPEPADSGFCEKLRREWIFELDVEPPRGRTLPPLPEWAARVPEIGIFVPLLVEDELIGFVGMQRSLGFTALTWEDLEILKTSARQIASYIARYQAGEQLARARQFDTYN